MSKHQLDVIKTLSDKQVEELNTILKLRKKQTGKVGKGFFSRAVDAVKKLGGVRKAVEKVGDKALGCKDKNPKWDYNPPANESKHQIFKQGSCLYNAKWSGPGDIVLPKLTKLLKEANNDVSKVISKSEFANPVDRVAMLHDIAYTMAGFEEDKDKQNKLINDADLHFINRLEKLLPNDKLNVTIPLNAMKAKVVLQNKTGKYYGANEKPTAEQFEMLKKVADALRASGSGKERPLRKLESDKELLDRIASENEEENKEEDKELAEINKLEIRLQAAKEDYANRGRKKQKGNGKEDIIKKLDQGKSKSKWAISGSKAIKYWADKLGIKNDIKPNDTDIIVDLDRDDLYDFVKELGYFKDKKDSPPMKKKAPLSYENVQGDVDLMSMRIYGFHNFDKTDEYLNPNHMLAIYDQLKDDGDDSLIKDFDEKYGLVKEINEKWKEGKGLSEEERRARHAQQGTEFIEEEKEEPQFVHKRGLSELQKRWIAGWMAANTKSRKQAYQELSKITEKEMLRDLGKKGRGKKPINNWDIHLKKFWLENKGKMTYKECMTAASKTYKRK